MNFYNFRLLFYSEDHRKRFIEDNPELLSKTKFFDKKYFIDRNALDHGGDPNIYLLSLFHRRTLNSVRKTLKPYVISCEGDTIDLRIKHGKNRRRKNISKTLKVKEEEDETDFEEQHEKKTLSVNPKEEPQREIYSMTVKKEEEEP